MLPLRTILHPTDFSERSAYAFKVACSLARDYGARLVLAHVKSPPVVYGGELAAMPPEPPEVRQRVYEQLCQVRPADPGIQVEHVVKEGAPAEEIICLAQESHSDVIVMGTHGRTGLGRVLMGSVAEEVLRKAPCPVLTVKAPLPEAASAAGARQEPATV